MLADGWAPSERLHTVTLLPFGQLVALDSLFGLRTIGLHITQRYRIIEVLDGSHSEWTVGVTAYVYQVTDGDGQEVFAYHWDADDAGLSWAKHPHLHVSRRLPPVPIGRGQASVRLGRLHLPTEHVAFQAIVRLLILEMGVPVRRAATGWRNTLDAGEADVRRRPFGN